MYQYQANTFISDKNSVDTKKKKSIFVMVPTMSNIMNA